MKSTTRQLLLMTLLVMTGVTNAIAGTNISLRFTANDAASSITSNITIGDFTIYATSSKNVSIDSTSKTVGGQSFTYALNLKGGNSSDSRLVSFPVEGPCTIRTYGVSPKGRFLDMYYYTSATPERSNKIKTQYCLTLQCLILLFLSLIPYFLMTI